MSELVALERQALDAFRRRDPITPWDGVDPQAWVAFGLLCSLEAGCVLRVRSAAFDEHVETKGDGSPVTHLERVVELGIRERLQRFERSAAFLGEETGGTLPDCGYAVAVDPVDGTWGLLSGTASWACVITVLCDGEPFAGFVANPVTGELAYALRGGRARLVRLSAFGEPPAAHTLPTSSPGGNGLLVCLHPDPDAKALRTTLHEAWRRGELDVVRSPGGSPAWSLVEAARGHYVTLNAWSSTPAQPFDLAAGALILRSAGGEVVDASGKPIDATRHAGPWLAGIDADKRSRVAELVRSAWPGAAGGT